MLKPSDLIDRNGPQISKIDDKEEKKTPSLQELERQRLEKEKKEEERIRNVLIQGADKLYKSGVQAEAKGLLKEALDFYLKSVEYYDEIDPNLLGKSEAQNAIDKVVNKIAKGLFLEGKEQEEKKNFVKAKECYLEAVELEQGGDPFLIKSICEHIVAVDNKIKNPGVSVVMGNMWQKFKKKTDEIINKK
jgi:tetratricopeptide (TPR) repeat protein